MPGLELLIVEKVIVLQGFHVLVEFENERARSGDVVGQNFLLGHAGEVHDDGTEGVSMGDNDSAFPIHHLRADRVVPVGQHTVDSDLKRLSRG